MTDIARMRLLLCGERSLRVWVLIAGTLHDPDIDDMSTSYSFAVRLYARAAEAQRSSRPAPHRGNVAEVKGWVGWVVRPRFLDHT